MTLTESIAYWIVRCTRSPMVDTAIEIVIVLSIRIVMRIEEVTVVEVEIEEVIVISIMIVIRIEVEIVIEIVMQHSAAASSKPFHWLLSMLTRGSGCDQGSSHLNYCR